MNWMAAALASLLLLVLARRSFPDARTAVICCGLFLAMPVLWSAVADRSSYLPLLPLAVAWLLFVNEFLMTQRLIWIVAAASMLAAMPFVHWAGLVMAPIYAAITVPVLVSPSRQGRALVTFATILVIASAPWLWPMARGASPMVEAINGHGLYDAGRFNVLQGIREMTSWVGLTVRSEVYWDCFNPAFLFLGNGALLPSLLHPQVFLLPMAIPLVLGLAQYASGPQRPIDWVVLAAFLAAAIVPAILAQPPVASRLLLLAPAAAIISARPFRRGA